MLHNLTAFYYKRMIANEILPKKGVDVGGEGGLQEYPT